MEWWPFVLIFVYLFMIAAIEDARGCLPALLTVSGVIWLLISISNYLSHYISAVHVFGFIVLWFPALMAYSYWNYHRCPACRTRNVFHPTGTLSEDGLQEECRCDRCSHTGWQAVSQSSGDGGGGDGGFGGGDGGCGGAGGCGGGGGG